ncbi:MAG: MetQ/NlpA family ABC transporter substrate-binding protein [Coriobacteriia bacterium]|nr:MetQ/NlpA family ABC transporter substrate-binding protein [Coriobacteriia bacterium]
MKRMIVRVSSLVLALALMVALVGCGNTTKASSKASAPVVVKIGTLQTDDLLALWVALDNGTLKSAGLDVQVTTFQSAQEEVAAMTAGKIDGMMTDMVVPVQLNAAGTPVKAITVCQTAPAGIIAGKNSGITQLSQLAGVPTGCSSPTAMEYIYDTALKNAGIAADQIKTTEIKKIPVRLQMLGAGQLKAAVLPWTLFTAAQLQGGVPLLDQKQAAPLTSTVLVFSQKFLDTKDADKTLTTLLTQYNKGVDTINAAITSDPAHFSSLLIKEAKLPESLAAKYQVRQYSQASVPAAEQFESVVSWMMDKGYIKKTQDASTLIYQVKGFNY